MAVFAIDNPLVFTFGILGNLVSFMVFLAPAPTFYRIFKKKSTQGFHSLPYVVALLSSVLWIYYATVKSNETLLITINSIGCFIEAIYISIYISYATKKARVLAIKLLLILNVLGFGLVLTFTHFLLKGGVRVQVLGWVSVVLSAGVYIAPLSIMKQVIRTKSVEFLPVSLSFALLFNSVMWFFYGLLLKDFYIAGPNIVGFIFGAVQIILYFIYKNSKPEAKAEAEAEAEAKLPTTLKPKAVTPTEIHPVCSLPIQDHDQNLEIITVAEENSNRGDRMEAKETLRVDVEAK